MLILACENIRGRVDNESLRVAENWAQGSNNEQNEWHGSAKCIAHEQSSWRMEDYGGLGRCCVTCGQPQVATWNHA